MASKGEVDPWNIDVIEVSDRFLNKLEKAQKLDLRVSGRVLLFAAILVRMKADVLSSEVLPLSREGEEEAEHYEDHGEAGLMGENYGAEEGFISDEIDFSLLYEESESLEDDDLKDDVLKTLLSPRKKMRRFTTLKDLIKELQNAENVEKRRRKRKNKSDEREHITRQTMETAHEEDIEETILKVEGELKGLFNRKTMLYFSEVVRGMNIDEKISYYLSVLHLAYRKKIEVNQKRLYEEDIEIKMY